MDGRNPAAILALIETAAARAFDLSDAKWQSRNVDRERVIAILRAHEAELKSAGIVSLSLFGSVARGDASDHSDVDLMAEFDAAKRLSLLKVVGLQNRLTDILGVPADLAQTEMLKADVRERASREAVPVF